MNIDKQDERLLHEILSKYKQGIISGLYPGTNITFTPTGCRDKIISSTGEGGDFDLFNETISYPLGDPINLTGGEVFFIAGAEGLTLSLTQLSTAILSQVTNTGGAFLEKEQVNTSRSFQSSDKNKILYIGSDTRLTVAEGITFADGDIIGVSYSIDSPDNRSGFSIVPNGHLIFPYCSIDSVPNEVVYLSALNIEGQTVLIPISTFIKISDAINNEAKTGLRYLMDNTSGTQPLSSTLVEGNTTGGTNILINNNDAVELENGSLLKKGTIDAGLGGGISQVCAVGYELKWEAGRLYVMNDGGNTIRHSLYNFTTAPTVTDDVTKGYAIDSLWVLDNGAIYKCTDATEGAAIWIYITPRIYEAIISQTGTDAPTVVYTVKDDLDGDITFTRTDVGDYRVNSSAGLLFVEKASMQIGYYGTTYRNHISTYYEANDNNSWFLKTYDDTGTLADNAMTPITIKITVYSA